MTRNLETQTKLFKALAKGEPRVYKTSTEEQIAAYLDVEMDLKNVSSDNDLDLAEQLRKSTQLLEEAWENLSPTGAAFLFMQYGEEGAYWIQEDGTISNDRAGRAHTFPEGIYVVNGRLVTRDAYTSQSEHLHETTIDQDIQERSGVLETKLEELTGLIRVFDTDGDSMFVDLEKGRYMTGDISHQGVQLSLWDDFDSVTTLRSEHDTDEQWAAAVEARFTKLWDEFEEGR